MNAAAISITRVVTSVTAALVLLVPAAGAQNLAENYRATHAAFLYENPEDILDGLDGEWLPLSQLSGDSAEPPPIEEIEGHVERFCGTEPPRSFLVTATGSTSLTITYRRLEHSFEYKLHWIGGMQFVPSFDAEGYFHYLGFDDSRRFEDMRASALRGLAGEVGLFRPAPDILVLTRNMRPEILGRCPDQ